MPGKKKSEMTEGERKRIRTLRQDAGWKLQDIADLVDRSVSAVYQVCNAPSTPKKKRSGRPTKIDTPSRQQLVSLACKDALHRRKCWMDLGRELNWNVSMKALTTAFNKEGFGRRIARKKVFLTAKHKENRLEWCLARRHWTAEQWSNVIFTDECSIAAGGARGNIWVTRRPGEEYKEECIAPKFKKFSLVMVWGGIRGGKKTPLVIWDKNNWGNISSKTYCDHILYPALFPFWLEQSNETGAPCLFVEDGAPGHRSPYTTAERDKLYLTQYKLVWPANSPDLNPIENLWWILKERISRRSPRPTKVDEVIQAAKEEWDLITEEEILEFTRSLPERVEAVIQANGGHIKW